MGPEKQNQDENKPSLSDHGITKKIAKKTFTVLRSISTAGGSGVGAAAGIAVFVVLFILIVTIITTISGGGAPVIAGTPPTTSPPPIYGCEDDLDGVLASHNITVTGVQTCERKAVIVNAVVKLFSYPDFAQEYGNSPLTIRNFTNPSDACYTATVWYGCTHNGGSFDVKNIDNAKDPSYWNYIITHEMFHVLDNRTGRDLSSSYDYATYYSDEPDCYNNNYGGVFKTYQLPTSDKSESMAESGAVYVTGGGGTGNFSDFEATCPDNYEFWNQEIGDPQYNNGGGDTGDTRTGELVTFTHGNRTVTTHKSNASDCNGKLYGEKQIDLSNTDKFPLGNFGDPNCDFSKEDAIALVKELDPGTFTAKNGRVYQRYQVWDGVIHCESGYFPDNLNPNSSSGWGGWGLFQMNPDFANRGYDNGTTDWRIQIQNAITRNNNHGGKFTYWSCARGFRQGTKDPRPGI